MKNKKALLAISVFIVGMFLCVLLAAIDNYSGAENAEENIILQIALFLFFMLVMCLFFFIGTGILGYENMSAYFIHNIIFYIFLIAIIILVIFQFKKKR